MNGRDGAEAPEDRRLAVAGLSRCTEPEDAAVASCAEALGVLRLWEVILGSAPSREESEACAEAAATRGLRGAGGGVGTGRSGVGVGVGTGHSGLGVGGDGGCSGGGEHGEDGHSRGGVLAGLIQRVSARAREANPALDLRNARALGGGLLLPGDPGWPTRVDDLGDGAPLGLWFRGRTPESWERAPETGGREPGSGGQAPGDAERAPGNGDQAPWLGVVGTRDPSGYGAQLAQSLAARVASAGVVVVSGGALGIDAIAHRAALEAAAEGSLATVCVLAGGVDRLYPAANAALLGELGRDQLLLSEHPPGCAPTRWRFLSRNRLIAALSVGAVVVEGRWRSGSLSTAHRAAELGRWVGALPGPVTSACSEGPHRLIREGAAELVSEPGDVLEAIGHTVGRRGTGPGAAPDAAEQRVLPGLETRSSVGPRVATTDGLDEAEARVYESLPLRRGVGLDRLLVAAGLGPPEALPALYRLQAKGLAEQGEGGWRRGVGGRG